MKPNRTDSESEPISGQSHEERASPGEGSNDTLRFLEREIWPRIPEDQLGAGPDKRERESILGLDTQP